MTDHGEVPSLHSDSTQHSHYLPTPAEQQQQAADRLTDPANAPGLARAMRRARLLAAEHAHQQSGDPGRSPLQQEQLDELEAIAQREAAARQQTADGTTAGPPGQPAPAPEMPRRVTRVEMETMTEAELDEYEAQMDAAALARDAQRAQEGGRRFDANAHLDARLDARLAQPVETYDQQLNRFVREGGEPPTPPKPPTPADKALDARLDAMVGRSPQQQRSPQTDRSVQEHYDQLAAKRQAAIDYAKTFYQNTNPPPPQQPQQPSADWQAQFDAAFKGMGDPPLAPVTTPMHLDAQLFRERDAHFKRQSGGSWGQ